MDYLFGMSIQPLVTTKNEIKNNKLLKNISRINKISNMHTKYCKAGSLEVCEQLGFGEDRAALVSSSTRFFALEGLVASQVARRSAEVTVADLELPAWRLSLSRNHCR